MSTNVPQSLTVVHRPAPRHHCPLPPRNAAWLRGTIARCDCGQRWRFIAGDAGWERISALRALIAVWLDGRGR